MNKRVSIIAMTLVLALVFNSCGVMFGGSRYEAKVIAKDRPNADIYVNGEKAGRGTVNVLQKRNKPMKVELKEEGCDTTTKIYEKVFRTGNFILSVVTWGIAGIVVDLATGAAYKPDHKHDPTIKKIDDKSYVFEVPTDCKK